MSRLEVYEDSVHPLFTYLIQLEKNHETLGQIDDSGLFTCDMDHVPIHWVKLNPIEDKPYCEDSKYLYRIPSSGGDIIHSVRIHGRFKSAEIFQYSFLDGRLTYDHVSGLDESMDASSVTDMCPFPQSGIPVIQVRKNIYLELIPENDADPIKVEYGYGLLDEIGRAHV